VAVQIAKKLAITMEPFTPFTAEELWKLLNLPDSVHEQKWEEANKPLQHGHRIIRAKPLFHKIEESEKGLQNRLEKLRLK